MGREKTNHGFSLLEILVAVTIMGLAYVAILQNFSISARNIANMDEGRTALIASSLAFEMTLLSMEQPAQGVESGEVLAEGGRYQLTQIIDDNDDFMTLKLTKK